MDANQKTGFVRHHRLATKLPGLRQAPLRQVFLSGACPYQALRQRYVRTSREKGYVGYVIRAGRRPRPSGFEIHRHIV